MFTRMLRVIVRRHWTSEAFALVSANNQPGTVTLQGRYTNSRTQEWGSSLHVRMHVATLTSTAEASYSLRADELKSFLLTGVLRVISKEKWTNKTLLLAAVRNEMGDFIHRTRYTYSKDRQLHAEEQLMHELERAPEREEDTKLIDRAKEIELLINYSPCDRCAHQLIQMKTNYPCLKITIKCAHLYNVWPQLKLAWANVRGLRAMHHADIRVQAFTNEEWLQLLLDHGISGSSLPKFLLDCGYDMDRAKRIVWGRNKADDTTREALDIIQHRNAAVADVHKVYKRAMAEARKEMYMYQDQRGSKR